MNQQSTVTSVDAEPPIDLDAQQEKDMAAWLPPTAAPAQARGPIALLALPCCAFGRGRPLACVLCLFLGGVFAACGPFLLLVREPVEGCLRPPPPRRPSRSPFTYFIIQAGFGKRVKVQ